MTQARKRMRLEDGSSTSEALQPSATMNDLPSEVVKNIFSFVGKGNYCFVAPVSKEFCYNYLTMDVIEDKFAHKMDCQLAIGKNKFTTAEAASSSFELAEYCFFEAPDDFLKKIVKNAIRKGKRDILELGHAMGIDVEELTRFNTEFREIAEKGDIDMFKLLLEKDVEISSWLYQILPAAASNNQLQLLKWLHRNNLCQGPECKSYVVLEAIKNGNMQMFKWAQNVFNCHRIEYVGHDFLDHTAKSDGLELIQYLRSQEISWGEQTFRFAAKIGNISFLQYLVDTGCPHEDPSIYTHAMEIKDNEKALEVLQWLHQHGVPWNENTCFKAVEKGNLQALKYLRSNDCPWNDSCLIKAIENHHQDIVEYCIQNSCPFGNYDICRYAMYDEDHDRALKMLKLLRKNSVPWGLETCTTAARKNNFQALQWAFSQGCAWDRQMCACYAAERGNIEALNWIKSQGHEWDEEISARAAKKGHLETLKFLKSQGCPFGGGTFRAAISSGYYTIIEYCIENDIPFDDYTYADAIEDTTDPIPIIKLLRNSGYPWHRSACARAAMVEDIDILRWLRFNGCPWDESVCNEAVTSNDLEILKYARENGCPWTKETYAYCFSDDGLENEYYSIPTADDIECSKEIFEYIQEQKCPQPDPSDWNIIY
ncbi:hypothetical protein CTEN210_09803 [Chaetoceros tenuissimus]|uniref:F-box domain-containing protein n=1 Tax=Chaetoceros tenuissimus TaxID=426638 RepID=A0AAD3H7D4_9STRA|nr:hypothetical protein CTEN210_09803 [Chaetoceros tenuissimus]